MDFIFYCLNFTKNIIKTELLFQLFISSACRWMSDEMLSAFTAPLIGEYPNTYTFTKALAEHLIQKESDVLRFMIVRPSIVSSSISDPFPVSIILFIRILLE